MYIDCKITKFQRLLFSSKKDVKINDESSEDQQTFEVKNVFDHKLKTLNYMFFACHYVKSIKFINVDTSYVTEMKYTFPCYGLKNLDMSCFNTKNLKNICNCFFGSEIEEFNLSNFNFENIDENDMLSYGLVFGRSFCKKLILSKSHNKKIWIEYLVILKSFIFKIS